LLLFYGLSATLYAQVFYNFYLQDTGGYLLFLTLSVAILNFLGYIIMTTKVDAMDDEPLEKGTLKEDSQPSNVPQHGKQSVTKFSEKQVSCSSIPELLIASKHENGGSNTMERRDSNSKIESSTDPKQEKTLQRTESSLAPNFSPWEILKSPTFWLYTTTFIFQQGLTYISNISQIIGAAKGRASLLLAQQTAVHVTVISLAQSLGRVGFGIGADAFSTYVAADRSILLFVAELILLVPMIVLAVGATDDGSFYFCSIMVGLGWGAGGALYPQLTRDYFGTKYYVSFTVYQ
jgi:hypothetical protein